MIGFIDDQREAFGVEPICKLLPIAPSTYYDTVAKRTDVDRLSVRARRDVGLKIEIGRVFDANYRVYGVRKVWRQLQREGFEVARCTVARLMKTMGLQGIIRGKPVRTTVSEKPFHARSTRSTASSMLLLPTGCGCRTSLTSRRGQG